LVRFVDSVGQVGQVGQDHSWSGSQLVRLAVGQIGQIGQVDEGC
jgi:hypothetical protein